MDIDSRVFVGNQRWTLRFFGTGRPQRKQKAYLARSRVFL